jgi:hypothetical protein
MFKSCLKIFQLRFPVCGRPLGMRDYQLVGYSSYGTLVVNFGSLWRSRLYVVSFSVPIGGGLCAVCPYAVLPCISSFMRLFLLSFLVFVSPRTKTNTRNESRNSRMKDEIQRRTLFNLLYCYAQGCMFRQSGAIRYTCRHFIHPTHRHLIYTSV